MKLKRELITKGKELPGPDHLIHTADIEGDVWIAGEGSKPSRLMIVGQNPGREELEQRKLFVGRAGEYLRRLIVDSNMTLFQPYLTNAVKHATLNNKAPSKTQIKQGLKVLMHEIETVEPELIITLGGTALEAVCGKKGRSTYKISDYRGEFVEPEWLNGIKVLALWHPAYILRQPERSNDMLNDMEKARKFLADGEITAQGKIENYEVLESTQAVADWLIESAQQTGGKLQLGIDAEWQGAHPQDDGAYMRTLQLCTNGGNRTAVIRFYPTATEELPIDPEKQYSGCADPYQTVNLLKMLLETMKGSSVFGHNIIADGEWLMHYGLDIRPYVIFDTMLAEHLLDDRGPFSLTDVTLKYAPDIGRYDRWLKEWLQLHPELVKGGFGAIPEEILMPYAAGDVQTLWKIMKKQMPKLESQGHFERLGAEQQYPCLFELVIKLSGHLYDLHKTGIQVDKEQLDKLTKLFTERRNAMKIKVATMAANRGFSEFNPNSSQQKQALLFSKATVAEDGNETGGLGLTPLKSTGKRSKDWEWVMKQPLAVQKKYKPSTDGETLETLQEKHPIVRNLLNYNRINTVCKNFLREDGTGGINGNIWPDGRIHSQFSQLTHTGRLRSSKPNCQNQPKASEGYIREIFEDKRQELIQNGELSVDDLFPPSIRSVFVAPPGFVLVECDYVQAELFVTAGISSDSVMYDLLATPGKDMHDTTTINSFQVSVLMPDGSPYDENAALAIAAKDENEFSKFQSQLLYVDPRDRRMTRSEFKDTLRVSGKSINFGILYGRGAKAIANQINAETGLGVTSDEIQKGIDAWHKTYGAASSFFRSCQEQALNDGYVANIWGRRRNFGRAETPAQEGNIKREAANHPIQGTVGDTMSLAIDRIAMEIVRRGLRMRIINQVHDALLFEVPEDNIDECVEVIRWGMAKIDLPMPGGPLQLGVDIDFYKRWGEKEKNY